MDRNAGEEKNPTMKDIDYKRQRVSRLQRKKKKKKGNMDNSRVRLNAIIE